MSLNNHSQVILIGQAPSRRVHETGIPWDDPSGDRLRDWLGIDKESFYNPDKIALIPMGFCYPGKGKSGDLPPMPDCAPKWHPGLFEHIKRNALTILIGQYSQRYYLKDRFKGSLTETVLNTRHYLPDYFPLPHPSPRNIAWFRNNPWFNNEILPLLKTTVKNLLL